MSKDLDNFIKTDKRFSRAANVLTSDKDRKYPAIYIY